MAAIAIIGVLSYSALPVADMPSVDDPTLRMESFKAQRTGYGFC